MEYTIHLGEDTLNELDKIVNGGVEVEPLEVTENGEYTAPDGKAYSPVSVNVGGGGGSSIQTVEVTVVDDTDEARIALPLTVLDQGALVTRIQQQPGVFNVVFTGDELIIVMDTTLNTARFSVAGNAEIRQNFGITAIAITGASTITFSDNPK